MKLKGKVAIITGGSRGQGAAEAKLFAKEGASVIIGDILDDEGEKVANEIEDSGGSAKYVSLDVQNEVDWRNAVKLAITTYGKLDILVNNAAILTLSTIEETTKEEWDKVMDINMWGIVLGTKAVLPAMRKAGGGAIVNISSLSAIIAQPWAAAYHASKGGVTAYTKKAAISYAKYNIRVNAIQPGFIATEMGNIKWEQHTDTNIIEEKKKKQPLPKMGHPLDVAYAALYFASDESAYVTGATLLVDGGISSLLH